MSRSLKKGPFIDHCLYTKVQNSDRSKSGMQIKTRSRRSTILPMMVGMTIGVHNGRAYVPVIITPEMVGHKLGEFVLTRLFKMHAGDRKSK